MHEGDVWGLNERSSCTIRCHWFARIAKFCACKGVLDGAERFRNFVCRWVVARLFYANPDFTFSSIPR